MKGSVIWNLQRYSSLIVLSYVVYVTVSYTHLTLPTNGLV